MRSIILHNPGCGDPSKLCDPHPPSLLEPIEFYAANPEVLVGVAGAILLVGMVQRYRKEDG